MNESVAFRMQVDYMLDRLKNPEVAKLVKEDIEEIKKITRLEILSLDTVGKLVLDRLKEQRC